MRRVLVLLAVALTLASSARAGGERVDLVLHDGTVWTVGDFGLRALDARTGRTTYEPQPTSARYDLGVAVAGRAVFVASVENGFTNGEVTRIDLRTHAARVVWRGPKASAQYVAAGAGGVYVLVGSAGGSSVLRLSAAGRVTGRWSVVDAGRIAADASGCWVAATHRLLHIRPDGRIVEVLTTKGLDDVATGAGAVWLLESGKLIRVDELTRVVRGLDANGLRAVGAGHELAAGAGHLWTAGPGGLQQRNVRTGALERTVALGGMADAVAVAGGALWVGTSGELYRLDARTLRVTLRIPLL